MVDGCGFDCVGCVLCVGFGLGLGVGLGFRACVGGGVCCLEDWIWLRISSMVCPRMAA